MDLLPENKNYLLFCSKGVLFALEYLVLLCFSDERTLNS